MHSHRSLDKEILRYQQHPHLAYSRTGTGLSTKKPLSLSVFLRLSLNRSLVSRVQWPSTQHCSSLVQRERVAL